MRFIVSAIFQTDTSTPSTPSSVDQNGSGNLKFIHSKFVIALVAPEFLSSWMARNYFQLALGLAVRTSSINRLPRHISDT
ncbi:MAG TPA: hypothetical protein VI037_07075 [Nitrososphaera sp.]